MEMYYYHNRVHHESWLLMHIDVLLTEAKKNQNVSFILYACLECRNLLEKIEFDLILMSTNEKSWQDLIVKMKVKGGIQNANKELKTLKYRLQTFSECISKVSDLPVKAYDYKRSEELQKGLSDYVHIYTRTQDELTFGSEFINNGIEKIEETKTFIKSFFVKSDDSYTYGVLNFETLKGGKFFDEFTKWRNSVDTDTDALYERLKRINDTFYGGAKATPIN
jgi:hypothetical protein